MSERFHLRDVEPLMREVIEAGGEFVMNSNGTSMLPMLSDGKDRIVLVRASLPLKRGDVALYKRKSGQYVLHRAVKIYPDASYGMCGDNQYIIERGVTDDMIIAKLKAYIKAGKRIECAGLGYRFYVSALCFRRLYKRLSALPGRLLAAVCGKGAYDRSK